MTDSCLRVLTGSVSRPNIACTLNLASMHLLVSFLDCSKLEPLACPTPLPLLHDRRRKTSQSKWSKPKVACSLWLLEGLQGVDVPPST